MRAISAAALYPIRGERAVARAGLFSTNSRHRTSSAVIPRMHFWANRFTPLDRSEMDCSRLCAITGIITFNSKFPDRAAKVMAASLPITWAHICITVSGRTGLIFPGMIDDPG